MDNTVNSFFPLVFVCLLLCAGCDAMCQSESKTNINDSIDFAKAHWSIRQEGNLTFRSRHFSDTILFDAPQYLFVAEVPSSEINRIHFAYDSVLTTTSCQALRVGALAAVNGSFFDMANGNPICFLRINGTEVGENTPLKQDTINRKYYQYATLCLNGDSIIFHIPDSSRMAELQLPYDNIMTAGPMLIFHDSILPQRDDRTFITHRHNRTAIGHRSDGTVVILVADGRHKQAEGLSINELSLLMRWMGCSDAINLDGGGSSTFYLRCESDETVSPVRNFPSDNGRFDNDGERPVSNIIYIL